MSDVKHEKSFFGIWVSVLCTLIGFLGAGFLAFRGTDQFFLHDNLQLLQQSTLFKHCVSWAFWAIEHSFPSPTVACYSPADGVSPRQRWDT